MTVIGLVISALTAIPSIISSLGTIFKGSHTASDKADAITSLVSTGLDIAKQTGQAPEIVDKAKQVTPMFHDLMTNLMQLAESSGQSGTAKQAYVSGIVTSAMQGWEKLSTGGQANTVEQLKPVADAAINNLVPVLFPKDTSGVGLS